MPDIHPTAVVHPAATLADNVVVGPMCIVEEHVSIGPDSRLVAQCYVTGYTSIGARNVIHPGAVIGGEPQDYAFDPACVSYLEIGDDNIFREGVSVHRGTKPGNTTRIGSNCFFMGYTHVAHDCQVGNGFVIVNGSGLTGYVTIGDNVFISGNAGVHQFCRVGRLSMLSGGTYISKDLPPFMIADGRNEAVRSPNLVGMRRRNFSRDTINAVRKIYSIMYRSGLRTSAALQRIKDDVEPLPEVQEFIEFVESSERGILQASMGGRRD